MGRKIESEPDFGGWIGEKVRDSTPSWPLPRTAPPGSPNIVVVVYDDVGFADLGCYGSEIRTPSADALAATGLRYTGFHTTAICSASRACLLTGRNHHAVGMGAVANWDTGYPGYRGRVAKSAGTMAEILRGEGYGTFAAGKWHLTPLDETTAAGPYHDWPTQRGFDRFHGVFVGGSDWEPDYLIRDDGRVPTPRTDGYHFSQDIVDSSIGFLRDHVSAQPEKPFFLYLCFHACHSPQHAPRDIIDSYAGRFDAGWDFSRAERLRRQLDIGIVPPGTGLPPRNTKAPPWADLSHDEQRVAARIQEAYAANLEFADAQVGRLISWLEDLGLRENTLIALLSDNGGTQDGGRIGSVNWHRHQNGLPDLTLEESLAQLDDIGGPTTYPVYASGWGQASNTPLKRYKSHTHGGGVRDPLILSWPKGISDAGGLRHQYYQLIDLLPTVLDVVGLTPPEEIGGVLQQPIDGVSMRETFSDPESPMAKRVQYFEMFGNRGIWSDGWKAVTAHERGAPYASETWDLYHLDEDFSEIDDRAADEPERLSSLVDLWWQEASRNQVLPLDDRGLERYLVPKPRPVVDRTRFRYLPGSYVPTEGMPNIRGSSYRITAGVEPCARAEEGVLLGCGDATIGYVLYVQAGRLVHDYNCAGEHFVVRSEGALPTGATTFAFQLDRSSEGSGEGCLIADGEVVGRVAVPRLITRSFASVGLMAGASPGGAVAPTYTAPFAYSGRLVDVVVDLSP